MATDDTESSPAAAGPKLLSRLANEAGVAGLIGAALWAPIVLSDLTTLARVSQILASDVLGRLARLELLTVLCLVLGLMVASVIPLVVMPRFSGSGVARRAVWLSVIAGSAGLAWVAPRALARGLLDSAPTLARLCVIAGLVLAGAALCGFIAFRLSARAARLFGYAGLFVWVLHWLVWPRVSGLHLLAVAVASAGVAAVAARGPIRSGRALAVVGSAVLASTLICAWAQPAIDRDTGVTAGVPARGPNVLVFVVDTQRWDRTSLGNGSGTTPNLAALAADPGSTTFTAASAAASATIPSVKSLFTSKASSTWGFESAGREPPPAAVWTLARAFNESGYATAALSTNGLIRGEGFETGFERLWVASGFDLYQHSFVLNNLLSAGDDWDTMRTLARKKLHKVGGGNLLVQLQRWLGDADPRPKFFYLHILEPHWPFYDHGRGFGSRVDPSRRLSHVDLHLLGKEGTAKLRSDAPELLDLRGRYEEELFASDSLLGDLLEILRTTGTDRDTLLVVTSDHGEEFLEHGRFSHGFDVFEEQIHVPLVIRWPGRPEFADMPERIDTPVSLLDVFPTLSDMLELPPPPQPFDGESLAGLLRGQGERGPVISESFEGTTCRASVRQGSYKVRLTFSTRVSPLDTTEAEVFDLAADPTETRSLEVWDSEVEDLVREARAILNARWELWPDRQVGLPEQTGQPEDDPLDGLRDLGYVQ